MGQKRIEPVQAWPDNRGHLHTSERNALKASFAYDLSRTRENLIRFFENKGLSSYSATISNHLIMNWPSIRTLMEDYKRAEEEYKQYE